MAPRWPVLKRYDSHHLARIALPLGGIGTGTVSLGGRGDLRDWELMQPPGQGLYPQRPGQRFDSKGRRHSSRSGCRTMPEKPVRARWKARWIRPR